MERSKASISDQLTTQVQAFTAWKQSVSREITRYRGWLGLHGLNNEEQDLRLAMALRTLKFDRMLLAFVGEFSRGKSELINAILGKHYGQRLLPTRSGRTTMCPTELFFDPQATGAFIKLLPIQTRGESTSLSTYKKQMEHWVHLPINLDDPASMRKAFTEVAQTREVSIETASELGFQVEYLETVLGKPGHVHIPAWRHALINIDHPLLRQGLAIIDTPGLNALGSEPELTLSLLPDAQALVFVLSADAGVTASDFGIWNSHVRDVASRRGTVLYAVLNKIDLLWDEDEDPREIEDSLRRLTRLTAQQLHLPEDHVMPITAKQAYKARINANERLFAESRMGALEHALARSVVAAKEGLLKSTLLQDLCSMVESSRHAIVTQRTRLETEARVMASGKRDSEYELVSLTRAAQQEQASYSRRLSILQQSRKLLESQLPRILESVSEERLHSHFGGAQDNMGRMTLNLGAPSAISNFFQAMSADLIRFKSELDTTEQLVQTLYTRYMQETGNQVAPYAKLDAGRYLRELAELEHQAMPYKSRLGTLMANQQKVFDRFFETLAREASDLYHRAREDSQRWCKQALAPLMQQALEAKSRLEKQMTELERLKSYGLSQDERTASLGAERDSLREQQSLLEDILGNLRGSVPESAIPTLVSMV